MEKQDILNTLVTELRRGTLTLIVLSQLKTSQYGYSLLQKLEKIGVNIDASTLYPMLRRLESQGLLNSEWETLDNRPRKYYTLNEVGQTVFTELLHEWKQLSEEMNDLEELK